MLRAVRRSPCGERGLKLRCSAQSSIAAGRSPCGERGLKLPTTYIIHRLVCRSPCGERGLKSSLRFPAASPCRRSPCGERGLKSVLHLFRRVVVRGRSPCGERGLKLFDYVRHDVHKTSLPVRGAWIEISSSSADGAITESLPVRGAWIEIRRRFRATRNKSRSPCGERGLK